MRTYEDLKPELNLIKRDVIRNWTEATLKNVPEYFWKAQASSTGKYHPACTIKEGGLITHVKRVVYLANRLCEGWGLFELDRDVVIAACILHDIAKTSRITGSYQDFVNHPLNAHKYYALGCELNKEPSNTTIRLIDEAVRNHMGRWTPDCIKKDIVDYSLVELVVYTSDYLAATKTLATPEDSK